jgi:photosystem II stability/assembly factor-like uncharacterized protein
VTIFQSRHSGFLALTLIWILLFAGCTVKPAPATPLVDLQWQPLNHGLTAHVPVSAIAFDPHHPKEISIALYHPLGLYTSADGGRSWRVDEALAQPLHALIYDHQQAGLLWAGSADGLYQGKWLDGRWLWQRVAEWPLARATFAVVQGEDSIRYAGGQGTFDQPPAVWRSRDGARWQPLPPLPVPAGSVLLSVATAGNLLLAGTDGYGLFVSRDSGRRWRQVAEIGETYVAALWIAPWNPALMLARTRNGLFRSADGAESWQRVDETLNGRPDAITAAPGGPIYLGMSTGEVLRSEDGTIWQSWGMLPRDGLFHTLVVDPQNHSSLYAGTHYGLYHSLNGGHSWQQIDDVGHFRAKTLAQDGDGVLYLGNDGGVYRSTDGGEQWHFRGAGLPLRTVQTLGVAADNPSRLYAGADAGIYRSDDSGVSWQPIGWEDRGVHGLLLDPVDPNRLYIRLAFERIYSTDQALSSSPVWTARWEGVPQSSEILSMAADPGDPTRLYAGGANDFFVSDNRAEGWRAQAPELRGQTIFTLVFDPEESRHIYAGATNGLYLSRDRGETWQPLGPEMISVTALAFDPARPDLLYAGTKHQGIWRSGDGGQSWHPTGPVETSVHALLVSTNGRWLYAATESGFWRSEIQ